MVWEFIFLMVILKIPIVYLCAVVWWAVRAEPRPPETAALPARIVDPDPAHAWTWRHPRRRPRGPHGAPARRYARASRRPVVRPDWTA
jgi:hypothetical protein